MFSLQVGPKKKNSAYVGIANCTTMCFFTLIGCIYEAKILYKEYKLARAYVNTNALILEDFHSWRLERELDRVLHGVVWP